MRVGFTGTGAGATAAQLETLEYLLCSLEAESLSEGDCVGADAEAANVAYTMGIPVISFPPDNPYKRAFFRNVSEERFPAPHLERNRAIVDYTDIMVAAPKGFREEVRSGTWYTVRYARKIGKRCIIVHPDGYITEKPGEVRRPKL